MVLRYARKCSHCGQGMNTGYCIEQGEAYYCSDECLYSNISRDEFNAMYRDGEGDTFYTEWGDDDIDGTWYDEDGNEFNEGEG